MATAIVILAAGASERMGRPKQLLPYKDLTLLRYAARTALSSLARSVVVVLGAREEQLRPELDGLNVQIAPNPLWQEGMGTSIYAGLAAVRTQPELTSVILTLADQPFLTAETYNRLITAHLATKLPIVASTYADTVGVPVLFDSSCFDALGALRPEEGCKGLILSHTAQAMRIPCPEAALDIDTPADALRLLSHQGAA